MPALTSALLAQARQTDIVFIATHGLIAWILIGLVAGWLTGKITRGRGFGCLVDIILGLVGAVIGGWLFSRLGVFPIGFWGSLATAVVGAVLLVAVARLFAGD
jgi:uncharacterized membrane protein YeaQ/YmgE (transglycosylase-associated protein family)